MPPPKRFRNGALRSSLHSFKSRHSLVKVAKISFAVVILNFIYTIKLFWKDVNGPYVEGLGKVPHNLWFTYKHDILITGQPTYFHQNIIKTIFAYRNAFDDRQTPAVVLDNPHCVTILNKVDKKLTHAFEQETDGAYKGDICRLGALYLYGGYYFDIDMETVNPIVLPDNVGFATAIDVEGKYYFNSFFAAAPRHPILKTYLEVVIEYYYDVEHSPCQQIEEERVAGPCMLFDAYRRTDESLRGDSVFLQEVHSFDENHCHYDVINPESKEVHFHSRIKGSVNCPFVPRKLWFTYEHDILKTKKPRYYHNNIQKTVDAYDKLWNWIPPYRVLDHEACVEIIEDFNPALRIAFEHDKHDVNKVDLCRAAVLFQQGGYFFHLDVEVVQALVVDPEATFAAVENGDYFSDSFMASSPGHPIFDPYVNEVIEFYHGNSESPCHTLSDVQVAGGCLLKESFEKLDEEDKKKADLFSIQEETKDSTDNDVVVSKNGEVLMKQFTRSTSWFHMF